jgi:hypothetical protein
MFVLRYRPNVHIADLSEDECTVHRAKNAKWRYWNLWWNSRRETDGELEIFCVPVLPNASYIEDGPGGRSWGLTRAGVGRWLISPSINVLVDEEKRQFVAGHVLTSSSIWHKTPLIIEVPEDESWARGEAP